MTNQGELQASIRVITGTTEDYNGDWHALFDAASIPSGEFNGRMVAYLQSILDTTDGDLDGLKQRYADLQGVYNWNSVTSIVPSMLSSNVLWVAANGNITTSSGLVDTWQDMSGNGNDFTASGASRPTLTSNQVNGLPALVFDGGDSMDGASALYTLPAGSYTAYIIAQRASESGATEALWGMSVTAANRVFNTYTATAGRAAFQNRTIFNQVEISGETLTDFNSIKCQRVGTIQAIEFNGGTDVTEAVANDVSGVDAFKIGATGSGGSLLTGSIAEFMIFNESLSAANQDLILSYINGKYNLF